MTQGCFSSDTDHLCNSAHVFYRIATVREKYLKKMKFKEKSRNFVDCQGKLERTWKVRET